MVAVKRIRFLISGVRDATANSVQFSKIEFRNRGENVLTKVAKASNPGGSNPGKEGPQHAIDGHAGTKFLDFSKKHLIIEWPHEVHIDEFRFFTGDDSPDRDPVLWFLECWDHDHDQWLPVQAQTSALDTPTARRTATKWFRLAEDRWALTLSVVPDDPLEPACSKRPRTKDIVRNPFVGSRPTREELATFQREAKLGRGKGLKEELLAPLSRSCKESAPSRQHLLTLGRLQGYIFSPHDADGAARHFHEKGFVVLADAVEDETLRGLQQTGADLVKLIYAANPKGNNGHLRWYIGDVTRFASMSPLVELEAVHRLVATYHDTTVDRISLQIAGGDFTLPTATEQLLHQDMAKPHEVRTPIAKVCCPLVDFSPEAGATRFVAASHTRHDKPHSHSIQAFCPAGSIVIFHPQVWHGGSANGSSWVRPMLHMHIAGPPYERYRNTDKWWKESHRRPARHVMDKLPERAKRMYSNIR